MSFKIRPSLLLSIVLLFMIGITLSKVEISLPKIDHENFELTSQENGYSLRIIMPDGRVSDEIIELINPGTPQQYLAVKATSIQIYPGASDKTSYTAEEMEYLDKYKTVVDALSTKKKPELGALALKSTAG